MHALGLMSGTSLDGIDVAALRTDGEAVEGFGPSVTVPYTETLRGRLRSILGGIGPVAEVEREMTLAHAEAVKAFCDAFKVGVNDIGVIGFHGHTILHRPQDRRTWQIGDGALLARLTGIEVVSDFRSADVAAGGQGAPLVPLYHRALARHFPLPTAVLNIGGVANVTWIGAGEAILAFDTGPGNALIDDWALAWTGLPLDRDGALARAGRGHEAVLARLCRHAYFDRKPPKSLDRDDFARHAALTLNVYDGAATLAAFTVRAVAMAEGHMPVPPLHWIVTGGGRHNPVLMAELVRSVDGEVIAAESMGWNGDALEAQAFAFLAVRSLRGLPISLPTTTGVARPMTGGRRFSPNLAG
ncbi:MAG: anhydro-N-acetylmuramic acid kinase [Rhodospirillaceae bacterium]|nr:anhydro-N-acetylmuramic acid kinase [Rhodospirillaceae bacterium]